MKKEETFKEWIYDENILVGTNGTIKTYYAYKAGPTRKKQKPLLKKPRIVKQMNHNKYQMICCYGMILYVHRLVCDTYHPKLNENSEVNHIDENKRNNCFENLEWMSHQENTAYSNGYSLIVNTVYYNSIRSAARILGIKYTNMRKIYNRSKDKYDIKI